MKNMERKIIRCDQCKKEINCGINDLPDNWFWLRKLSINIWLENKDLDLIQGGHKLGLNQGPHNFPNTESIEYKTTQFCCKKCCTQFVKEFINNQLNKLLKQYRLIENA